ncbi:hypothetical protein PUNSTDRAFT_138593 [Punctularia strigosozonata HHB-11173 SS5]|uniref:Uncharacterized protein n=1 Tax=Punctularia strigosozonata (strain HHB-11173) TaxID=741275 RepID=R7S3W4_PUNST|nr:uncharacterized protein PUNSTDRAFT_138593 [Punctularia strigosozonata HHB-11173 SS5]EIN04549.1 hypothetical protein PUNSTDRAFT_138593 [Punctularia strigosozonata HHB-11173 SS5]
MADDLDSSDSMLLDEIIDYSDSPIISNGELNFVASDNALGINPAVFAISPAPVDPAYVSLLGVDFSASAGTTDSSASAGAAPTAHGTDEVDTSSIAAALANIGIDVVDPSQPTAPSGNNAPTVIHDPLALDESFIPRDDYITLGYFIFFKKSTVSFHLRLIEDDGSIHVETIPHDNLNRVLNFDDKLRRHAVPDDVQAPDDYSSFAATTFNLLVPRAKAAFSAFARTDNDTKYTINGPSPRPILFTSDVCLVFKSKRRISKHSSRPPAQAGPSRRPTEDRSSRR